ncbi:MAG: UDP-N-acetylmuramoyl-L-alanine--D-glutamate ligase [Pseudomonadota bacterium]|nr:UDP-N-acetylmuramoyl-L-alanine--D-glutamate ligase [Pseudomonadota bacterium]
MIPASSFRGRHVAVVGLGGSGLATAKALVAGGARVVCDDDGPARRDEALAQGLPAADLQAADWSAFDALLLSPGVPLTHPAPHWSVRRAEQHGIETIGDMEVFARERQARAPRAPFIAITGTNGKSTTTALIAHLLRVAGRRVALGGNIGTPVLALDPPEPGLFHVLELSSYQIDLAPSLAPSVGVLLNVTEDHLDRHGTMENYAAIKARLVAAAETAVIGVDDGFSLATADRLERDGRRVIRVSAGRPLADGVFYETGALRLASNGAQLAAVPLDGIPSLRGLHNAQNAAAAFAAVHALGVEPRIIAEGLRGFPGLAHRMEEVGRLGRVIFVNDSKATNADAAAKALASFDDIYWIAGGRPKTGGIESLEPFFPKIRRAYLIGEAAEAFAATLEGRADFTVSRDLATAVREAARDAASCADAQPVVLLSPACASFDQFKNFEVRGDAFRVLVRALEGIAVKGAAA